MAGTGSRNDPFAVFNFQVDIEGIGKAAFSECSGLNTESDIIEYRTGDEDIRMRKLPGLEKFANLVFKRGCTDSLDLWKWREKVMAGKTERHSGSIALLNEARETVLRWSFVEGWPSKWEGPTLNAKTNEVAIETMEIAHEGLKLELA